MPIHLIHRGLAKKKFKDYISNQKYDYNEKELKELNIMTDTNVKNFYGKRNLSLAQNNFNIHHVIDYDHINNPVYVEVPAYNIDLQDN